MLLTLVAVFDLLGLAEVVFLLGDRAAAFAPIPARLGFVLGFPLSASHHVTCFFPAVAELTRVWGPPLQSLATSATLKSGPFFPRFFPSTRVRLCLVGGALFVAFDTLLDSAPQGVRSDPAATSLSLGTRCADAITPSGSIAS